jgi:hypothetical protein
MATESDKVNSGALLTIVVVGTFSMVGVCLGVNALVRHEVDGMSAERAQPAERPVRDLTAEQLGKLNAPPAWSDKAKGLVSLPVERAMEVVVADLARDPNTATPPPPADAGADAAAAADVADAGADAEVAPEGETDADAAAPDAAAAPNPTGIASSAPTAAAPPVPRPPAPGSVGPAPTPKPVDPKPPAPKPPAPPVAPPTDG